MSFSSFALLLNLNWQFSKIEKELFILTVSNLYSRKFTSQIFSPSFKIYSLRHKTNDWDNYLYWFFFFPVVCFVIETLWRKRRDSSMWMVFIINPVTCDLWNNQKKCFSVAVFVEMFRVCVFALFRKLISLVATHKYFVIAFLSPFVETERKTKIRWIILCCFLFFVFKLRWKSKMNRLLLKTINQ